MSLNEAAPEVEASLSRIKRKDRHAIKTEDYGSTSEALALAEECLPRLTQQIKTAIAKPERRHVRVVHAIANLPHDKIALCVLQVALESIIRQQEEYIETANRIGSALFEEYWMHEWETAKRNLGNSNTKAVIKRRALFAKIERLALRNIPSSTGASIYIGTLPSTVSPRPIGAMRTPEQAIGRLINSAQRGQNISSANTFAHHRYQRKHQFSPSSI